MRRVKQIGVLALLSSALILQACGDDSNPLRTFDVQIINSSNGQAFAPAAVVLHSDGYHPYVLGEMADEGLEMLAEGGDGTALLASAAADYRVADSTAGSGLITPGASETIQVQGFAAKPRLSLVTMLVNTNDGFAGLDSVDISGLGRNESMSFQARVYDAGTEANDEAAAHLPGQGGEGFNATRNDRDFVAVHPGVVGLDDGLSGSALDQSHRFDNPGARIVVTRTQ